MQLDTSVCMLVLHVRNTNSNSKLWQTQVSTEYVKIKIKKLNMKLLSCVSLAVCMFKTENKIASNSFMGFVSRNKKIKHENVCVMCMKLLKQKIEIFFATIFGDCSISCARNTSFSS